MVTDRYAQLMPIPGPESSSGRYGSPEVSGIIPAKGIRRVTNKSGCDAESKGGNRHRNPIPSHPSFLRGVFAGNQSDGPALRLRDFHGRQTVCYNRNGSRPSDLWT